MYRFPIGKSLLGATLCWIVPFAAPFAARAAQDETRSGQLDSIYSAMYGGGFDPVRNKLAQQAPKRIYIAPDDHTDYFWTAGEEAYQQAFLDMIDYYLDLADQTEGEPEAYQSRWNCDGSFWMWTYEKNRPPQDFERLMARVRSGHITIPLQALSVCLGSVPAEGLIRGLYYPGIVERRHNVRFSVAYAMENQTMPYGLGSLFAGSGARYSWQGICDCDTLVDNAGDRPRDIYWWEGNDGRRILMKWNSVVVDNKHMGGYAEARDPAAIVDFVDTDAEFRSRFPYNVIGAFGQGWDDLKTANGDFITAARQKTTASRQVIVSNQIDFFEDFEDTHGSAIPAMAVSFGNEWEMYSASLAETSARVKRAVEKLRTAELMAAFAAPLDPDFTEPHRELRERAWMNLGLFFEHNFGMVYRTGQRVTERIDWQNRLAAQVEEYVDTLYDDAAGRLGGLIAREGSMPRYYVLNPLGWARTDYADLPLEGEGTFHAVDSRTGNEVSSQRHTLDGRSYLRIMAEDVPPAGYAVYEVRPGRGPSVFGDAANVDGNIIENQYYRIELAPRGAIVSWIDKRNGGRELVREINGRAVNDLGPGGGSVSVEAAGPVFVTLRAMADGPLEHETRVTLYRNSDRIEIHNEILENFSDTHTWGFGFGIDDPDVWHEETGAVIRAKLLADGGHYAARNARYDWLTLNHFADMGNGSHGVTLSNADCYFMQLGNSTANALDTDTPLINVLAGGRVVKDGKGLPDQGGESRFVQRFALRSRGDYNAPDAMRFALEHQNPFAAAPVTGGNAYPGGGHSLLRVTNPDVLLWALKPAEDGGAGLVARVWNLSDRDEPFRLESDGRELRDIQRLTHIETPAGEIPAPGGVLSETLHANRMETYGFFLSAAGPASTPTPTRPAPPTASPSPPPGEYTVYEDAEDGLTIGWWIFDESAPGASIVNAVDPERGGRAIELEGEGLANGFYLGGADASDWGNRGQRLLQWDMNITGDFRVYAKLATTAGERFVYYSPEAESALGDGTYVHHGLGAESMNGEWQTFTRDLEADLREAQPDVSILEVNAFLFRGTGSLDNILLRSNAAEPTATPSPTPTLTPTATFSPTATVPAPPSPTPAEIPPPTPTPPVPTATPVPPTATPTPPPPTPTRAPTPTATPVEVNLPPDTVIVTDDLASTADLSGSFDQDGPAERMLALRWNFGEGDFTEYHVYVSVNGGDPAFLGRTGDGAANAFAWPRGVSPLIDPAFQDGPLYNRSYEFRVYGLREGAIPRVLRTAARVLYIGPNDPTPTPAPTETAVEGYMLYR